MATGYFIAGTDTECGKTEVTLGLMQLLQSTGRRVAGMKPVASGAQPTSDGLRNDDALRIQAQCSRSTAYSLVNPYAFEPPIAPHLAARHAGVEIEFGVIGRTLEVLAADADLVVVEGVGGWRVPLGKEGDLSNMARDLGLPVVLVVGVRLGCINHALLTADAIVTSGVPLAGWVANLIDPAMLALEDNLSTLEERLPAPKLGVVPWLSPPAPHRVAEHLRLP